jgi:hypothetical protein
MLAKVGNKDSHSVVQALIKQSRKLPKEQYCWLTWDRRTEITLSQKFKSTNMQDGIVQVPRIKTAFCERYSYFCAMMQEVNKIRLLVVEEPLSVFVMAAARRPGRGL